jgi:carboxypeptidase family protein
MRLLVYVTAVLLMFSIAGFAQTVAVSQISGTVRDQSGALLPGVEVRVTQVETGAMRSALTNETGSYTIPNLSVGSYRLEASLQGFSTYVQTGIVLQVNSNPTIPIVLQVGQVSQTIEIEANAALVETHSNGVGQVIDQQRVVELPLNGRVATELIFLSGLADHSSGRRSEYEQEFSDCHYLGRRGVGERDDLPDGRWHA